MSAIPYILEENNLSRAWAKILLKMLSPGVEELQPLVVTINLPQGKPVESDEIRKVVDEELKKYPKLFSPQTTSNTIFPDSLWTPEVGRKQLFDRYLRILPALRKHPRNHSGIYFERLINFGGSNNQLEHILSTREKGNNRRSEFQATIVIPDEDQSDAPRHGFPCLRQVMFIPSKKGLIISGVYGVQYIFDRAYGNYLGLCKLGEFMAHEMGIPLIQLQCVTTIAELGTPHKGDLSEMSRSLSKLLRQSEQTADKGGILKLEMDGISLLDDLDLEKESYAETR